MISTVSTQTLSHRTTNPPNICHSLICEKVELLEDLFLDSLPDPTIGVNDCYKLWCRAITYGTKNLSLMVVARAAYQHGIMNINNDMTVLFMRIYLCRSGSDAKAIELTKCLSKKGIQCWNETITSIDIICSSQKATVSLVECLSLRNT